MLSGTGPRRWKGAAGARRLKYAPSYPPTVPGDTLSVVIPTLNEAGNIGPLLERLEQALEGCDHEVLVVDGGSSDGTQDQARAAGGAVRVLEADGAGLAASVAEGIRAARGEFVCVMDGDGQHPPETVVDLLRTARWQEADLVVGSRYAPGGEDAGLGPGRRAISVGTRWTMRTAIPAVREAGLSDPSSGLFLFRRSRVDPDALDPQGYKILLEVLERGDFDDVEEVGYVFDERGAGRSKLDPAAAAATLLHLAELAKRAPWNRRLATFAAVGLLGVVVNLSILTGLTEGLDVHYAASATVAVEASILSNFALNDAFTFRDRRRGTWLGRLWRFNVVSLVALTVNLAVLALLTEVVGLFYLVSEGLAIGVAFLANFRGNLAWTYEDPEGHRSPPSAWTLLVQHVRELVAGAIGLVAVAAPGQGSEDESR